MISGFEVIFRHLKVGNLKLSPTMVEQGMFMIGGTCHDFICGGTWRIGGT